MGSKPLTPLFGAKAALAGAALCGLLPIVLRHPPHPDAAPLHGPEVIEYAPATQETVPLPADAATTQIPDEKTSSPEDGVAALRLSLAAATTLAQKRKVADALVEIGSEQALQAWGQGVLAESDPAVVRAMMSALDNLNGEHGLEAVTQLVELSDRVEVLDGLARILSRMANPETAKYLAELSVQAEVVAGQRDRALRLLGAIANPEAVPGLAALLYEPEFGTDVSEQACLSLGKIGTPVSVIALVTAFDALPEERFAARQQVIQSLASITNAESAAILEDLAASSPQPLVAAAAKDALLHLPKRTDASIGDVAPVLSPLNIVARKAPVSGR